MVNNKEWDITESLAARLDLQDPLARFKNEFLFPVVNGNPVIYFCGNSLGLQPRRVAGAIETELEAWQQLAVGGYFSGKNPWLYYHDYCKPTLGKLIGGS